MLQKRSGADPNRATPESTSQPQYTRSCPHCGCRDTEARPKPPHLGLYCSFCGKWLAWLPQGTPEERQRKMRERIREALAGKPTTDSQARLLRDMGAVEIPADRGEASKLIGELLAGRKGGAL